MEEFQLHGCGWGSGILSQDPEPLEGEGGGGLQFAYMWGSGYLERTYRNHLV